MTNEELPFEEKLKRATHRAEKLVERLFEIYSTFDAVEIYPNINTHLMNNFIKARTTKEGLFDQLVGYLINCPNDSLLLRGFYPRAHALSEHSYYQVIEADTGTPEHDAWQVKLQDEANSQENSSTVQRKLRHIFEPDYVIQSKIDRAKEFDEMNEMITRKIEESRIFMETATAEQIFMRWTIATDTKDFLPRIYFDSYSGGFKTTAAL